MLVLVLACTAGIYLGLHFSVWILVPTSLLGISGFMATSWILNQNSMVNAATIVVFVGATQAGYLLGVLAREHYHEFITRLKTRSA